MGIAYSAARKAAINWNATNRAVRFLDRTAKKRHANKLEWKKNKSYGEFESDIQKRDPKLEEKVASFTISSVAVKDSILPKGVDYVPKSTRKLPQV